ncbi:hypothetical protein BKE30_00680 [Alkanindiges hydrocarboniclasticus]|uniref:HEAT repeat domain-containing protein n=1 Tax=Alkanindiges hydrocarboniclasticus TaxID=1907941 RepID=A0A1S8CXZ0_9GAMM|nr:hypothetical protein [Alkanindiges hydrocarboniclasticus]ONG42059.1 hypothetical protein BKE30_00680 [Alkanindiges hydrocarboniclasticus]
MESLSYFEQQLHQLCQLLITEKQDAFSLLLDQLEFQYYTQPVYFNQLTQTVFELLAHPLAVKSDSTFNLYVFLSNNWLNLDLSQQQQLLSRIEADYANYQQPDVWRVINEIIGEKLANKAAWRLIQYLKDNTEGPHRAQVPLMLGRLIQHTSSTALKRQSIIMLQLLTQNDERLTRQQAQHTLQRTMRLMNPRIWRSLGLA